MKPYSNSSTPDALIDGFRKPPAGYGEVAFYWWLGDPLTRERLTWQLDQLAGMHISGLQVNYAHSDTGGRAWGLTYASDPPLFSEEWWQLFGWFLGECKRRDMSVSLSDYTIGMPGQGWYTDEIIAEHPSMRGQMLKHATTTVNAGAVDWKLPFDPLCVMAFRTDSQRIVPESKIDLSKHVNDRNLQWRAPEGTWQVQAVGAVTVDFSIDPMHERIGAEVCDRFFGRFEHRFPGEAGRALNFFFSDELTFNVTGRLWTDDFREQFARRKGYDIVPELPELFVDFGPATPKVRLDYWDVLVSLEEERFFKPLFDWHESRQMTYGCDHGGRGRDVSEFGDYFRTQRWNQGPGSDQPHLGKDIVKAKVAASIAHLYRRPRVWLEGFYGSGWGTSTAQIVDATFANFALGYNLLTLHGLYYSTHGGFWEWAPPCNHFHMPYWQHTREFMGCVERLSWLLSQGVHRCDVAVLYPVESAHTGEPGKTAGQVAFAAGQQLYAAGIDFDFIDWQSIERATLEGGQLRAADARYRVLVLPAMKALRKSTVEQVRAFHRAGGIVVAIGALPAASDHAGADDPWLDEIMREVFGVSGTQAGPVEQPELNHSRTDGVAVRVRDAQQATEFIAQAFPADFKLHRSAGDSSAVYFQHRTAGEQEVYLVYGAREATRCTLRATGSVELWDPWTGTSLPVPVIEQSSTHTTLHLPLGATEAQVLVFKPGEPTIAASVEKPAVANIVLDGPWEFELEPALDNRFGDFEWPPTAERIGTQVRRIRYRAEQDHHDNFSAADMDHSKWPTVTTSFGPRFWKLGPLPDDTDFRSLEAALSQLKQLPRDGAIEGEGRSLKFTPYDFSWRWGLEGDPGPQGYHGLKCRVTDDFIALGQRGEKKHSSIYTREAAGHHYYLWTSVHSPAAMEAEIVIGGVAPTHIWLRGEAVRAGRVPLNAGPNALLMRFDDAGRSHVVVGAPDIALAKELPIGELRMRWLNQPALLQFDPTPELESPAGWYRFDAPPGMRGLRLTAIGTPQVWVDGRAVALPEPTAALTGRVYDLRFDTPHANSVCVAIRVAFERGCYGGAALPEPIRLDCGPGTWNTGDWSANDGLASYSGGARYRRSITLSREEMSGRVTLDLGDVVSTAEVSLNGQPVGVRVAPPWRFDLTPHVREGENRLEVLVFSTLANHYSTIPSKYRGTPRAGLIGPVSLDCTPKRSAL